MSNDLLDRELVRQVQLGNTRAFDVLVLRYQWRLKRVVNRYVRNEQEVADVVQEALIKAYRYIPEFRGESSFYSWLYRIAVNTAKNYLQLKKLDILDQYKSVNDGDDSIYDEHLIENATPEVLLQCAEFEKTLFQFLHQLPDELRVVLILRELAGLSYDEMANALNCPIGTVRSRLARGRQILNDKLQAMISD